MKHLLHRTETQLQEQSGNAICAYGKGRNQTMETPRCYNIQSHAITHLTEWSSLPVDPYFYMKRICRDGPKVQTDKNVEIRGRRCGRWPDSFQGPRSLQSRVLVRIFRERLPMET